MGGLSGLTRTPDGAYWAIPERDRLLVRFERTGSSLAMSQWVTQRDRRHYPDPLRFEPDRWTPEARATRHQYAYFPFGGGSRACIGEEFTYMEMTLVLATLGQRFELGLAGRQPVRTKPRITLRPASEVRMSVEPLGRSSTARST